MNYRNISLGAAQFGSKYGVTNKTKLSLDQIRKILNIAYKSKITNIDSAYNYGNAEFNLGKIGMKKWKVSSKFPKIPQNCDPETWISNCVTKSLDRLKINQLETLFIHDTDNVKNFSYYKKIFDSMDLLKKRGFLKKIGISIYSPFIVYKLASDFKIDVIQSPANVFDDRIFDKKIQRIIKNHNIELEIRSIFLQGLLLEKPENIPKKFKKFYPFFKKIDDISKNNNFSKISVALSILKKYEYKKIIIGVNSSNQLIEIINNFKINNIKIPKFNIKNKKYLINPFLWNQKK